MGNADAIGCFDLRLVQDAEMWTGSFCRIIFGLDRENMAGHTTQLHNLHSEIIPTANPFVGIMVDTGDESTCLRLHQHR